MKAQAQLSRQHLLCQTLLPDAKVSNSLPMRRGGRAPAYVFTERYLESTTIEGAPVAEGLSEEANSIAYPRETTETEARSSLATVYVCTTSRRSIPAKFGCQPIKLELYPQAHAYPGN